MIFVNDPIIVKNNNSILNYIMFNKEKYFMNLNFILLNDDIKIVYNIGAKKYKFILYKLNQNNIVVLSPDYFINFQCNKLYKKIINYEMLISVPMINEMFN